MTQLGRGGSSLVFHPHTVVKTCSDHLWQATYMYAFPDAFMEVKLVEPDITGVGSYTMVRGVYSQSGNLHDALRDATPRLAKQLWQSGSGYPQSFDWRLRLRAHIFGVISRHHLDVSMVTASLIIDALPEVPNPRFIHGDATLANCVFDKRRRGWYWIDPMIRAYIPGDPHVDLGKLFQSCFGYEAILEDRYESPQPVRYDTQEMLDLLKLAQEHHGDKLDLTYALLWSLIHIIRLIPYQDPKHQPVFQQMFKDVWSWI